MSLAPINSRSLSLLAKFLRYHFFFFDDFSMPANSGLSDDSAEFFKFSAPLFGDNSFLYHFGFLWCKAFGLEFGLLFSDRLLCARSPLLFSLFNKFGWSTASVHIDAETVALVRSFGDGGQKRLRPVGVAGDDDVFVGVGFALPFSNSKPADILSLRFLGFVFGVIVCKVSS